MSNKYRVHIYAVVRIPVDVEAETPEGAAQAAEESINLHDQPWPLRGEYAEEIESFLVDGPEGSTALNGDYTIR